jgi:isoaspartyl peptidase/L-asparaginase-like protein (Ntn-hydrolase superfamily)
VGDALNVTQRLEVCGEIARETPAAFSASVVIGGEFGGSGGLIVVSATGGIGVAFNTTHMAWAWFRDGAEQSGI